MSVKPKAICLIDRRTRQQVGPAIPLKAKDNFSKLPRPTQRVWHYMDYWKFESLIASKSLYFRRSDKLEDDMEGLYAEANKTYTTTVWEKFVKSYGIQHDASARATAAQDVRYRSFLSCWHINEKENADMWRLFTKTPNSVVIVSTVSQLTTALRGHQVQPGRVMYEPQSTPRPEWSYSAPFFYKDITFMGEREFRLLAQPPLDQPVCMMTMLGLSIPIALPTVIDLVKVHPCSDPGFKHVVRAFLSGHGVSLPLSQSALPRLNRP